MGKFNLGEFALSLESAAVSDLDTSGSGAAARVYAGEISGMSTTLGD